MIAKKSRAKVSIIGAGNVGSSAAERVVRSGLADVVLFDIVKNIAQGKALDILDESGMDHNASSIIGTDDYSFIDGSSIVVVTAGLARRPGMTRDELLGKNGAIIASISAEIRARAPDSIVIIVTNPLDAMTYLAYKKTSFGRNRVMGMAGLLDESRFKALVAIELNVRPADVETVIMGSHGDTMVPILSRTKVKKKALSRLLPGEKIDELVARLRSRGAEIVNLLGSGSAYYSPSLAAFSMVEAVLNDTKEVISASAFLDGEYGLRDICAGVPVKLGRGGIERIVEIGLTEEEAASLMRSAEAIRKSNEKL